MEKYCSLVNFFKHNQILKAIIMYLKIYTIFQRKMDAINGTKTKRDEVHDGVLKL